MNDVVERAAFTLTVPQDDVSELMQHELLAVKRRVCTSVEDHILILAVEQQRTEPVVIAYLLKFSDTNLTPSLPLHSVGECLEGKVFAQLQARDCGRYGLFDIHCPLTVCLRASSASTPS